MNNEVHKIEGSNRFFNIVKGIVFAYIITVALVFIYSVILANTSLSDDTMPFIVTAITMLASFWSSTIFSKRIGSSGLLNGIVISTIYIGLIYVFGSLDVGFALNTGAVIMLFTTILTGGIGGIIGVNLNRFQR